MGASVVLFGLGLVISTVQSYNSHSGEYTVITKGLEPLHLENEYLKYDGEMTRINRYEKLLSGNCTIFQKLGPVGIRVKFLKEDQTGRTYPATIAPLTLENVCDKGFDENAFLEKFKRVEEPEKDSINLEDCTIDIADDYRLANWTIEPHIKKGLGKYFFYGDFDFDVTIFGKPDEETEIEYANFHLKLSIVNKELEEHKRQNRKKNGNNKKDKKEKKKEEGDSEEYPKDPEAFADSDTYKKWAE